MDGFFGFNILDSFDVHEAGKTMDQIFAERRELLREKKREVAQILKPKIREEISSIVSILKDTVPSLKEIRLYGSFINDYWDPDHSDIDICIETGDESYSARENREKLPSGVDVESKLRKALKEKILSQIDSEYKNRFSFIIMSPSDIKYYRDYNEGNKGPWGQNIKKGELLYQA